MLVLVFSLDSVDKLEIHLFPYFDSLCGPCILQPSADDTERNAWKCKFRQEPGVI